MDNSPFVHSDTALPNFAPGSPLPNWLMIGLTCPGIDSTLVREERRNITPFLSLRGLRAEVVRCLAYPQEWGVPWDGRWVEVAVLQGLLTDGQAGRLVGYAVGCLQDQRKPSRALPLAVLGPWGREAGCDNEPWYDFVWSRPTVVGNWNNHHILPDCGESDDDQILIGHASVVPDGLESMRLATTYDDGTRHLEVWPCKEHTDRLSFGFGAVFWEQITTEQDEQVLADIRAGRRQY